MRNEDFAVHVRRRRFVSKIICEGIVGGSCNGNQPMFIYFSIFIYLIVQLLDTVTRNTQRYVNVSIR